MGSLDVSSAKQQFFNLVDAISASHLPTFTIWLDAKLAEYKTIGQLKPDSEYESKEQYPEWIGKALRQNLSFLFPGPSQNSSSGKDFTSADSPDVRKRRSSETSDIGSERKRSKQSSVTGDGKDAAEAEDDLVMIVKEEPGGKEKTDYSRVTESPLPGIQSTFSLSTEQVHNFSSGQSAAFSFTTPSKSLTASPATMTPPNQTLSASLPRPSFSNNSDNQQGSSSKTLNFDSTYGQPMPLFSSSGVAKKLEASSQLSAPSPGEASAAYPVSSGAGQSSDAEGSEGAAPQAITDEAVQDAIRRYHDGMATYAVPSSILQERKNSEGKFVCPVCDKKSDQMCNYRHHFLTHTNERPFGCPYCPARFAVARTSVSHQRRKHEGRPIVKPLLEM